MPLPRRRLRTRPRAWRSRPGITLAAALALGAAPALLPGLPPASAGPAAAPQGQALAPSSPAQLALAEHLRRSGILFYGAWWCPACFRQKSLFGDQAAAQLPYVECDREPAGRERCEAAAIQAYPTWVKGKERLEGVQSLEALKAWSGFSD